MAATTPEKLITTYLEMTSPAEFIPAYVDATGIRIDLMQTPDVAFYLFLYRGVGGNWHWRDRLVMPPQQLQNILASDQTEVFVMNVDGVPAGYVELFQEGSNIEVAYFGLREGFIGRGLGKHLLSYGVQQAWDKGAKRVWVHTCNLDGPHALPNYQARGFRVYDIHEEPMPERYR